MSYQAIETRYFGPTTFKGSKIKAYYDDRSITIPYPYELGPGEECHREAARKMIETLGGGEIIASGATRSGYVFIIK